MNCQRQSFHLLRPAFQAARQQQQHTPAVFFQSCRGSALSGTTLTQQDRQLHSTDHSAISPYSNTKTTISSSSTTLSSTSLSNAVPRSFPTQRAFSTSPQPHATVVRLNPRVDDEGNKMTIEISSRAAAKLKQITSATPRPNSLVKQSDARESHLRVTVTSGGCHGFQYLMSLEPENKIDGEEDTVFVAASEQGESSSSSSSSSGGEEQGGGSGGQAEVVMDQASLELLKGSTVDFTTELIGSQFKIVGNPRAKSSCGCGTSFDVE